MSISYEEITDTLYVPECVSMQKEIFGLSESDSFPASFFNLIIRKEHPLGILVGAFLYKDNQKKLIGLAILTADQKPDSLYFFLLGVLPKYQNGLHGYRLILKVKEIALKKNVATIYGVFNPFDSKLGKLYTKLGAVPYRYISEPNEIKHRKDIEKEKIVFKWDIKAKETPLYKKISHKDLISKHQIINDTNHSSTRLLLEIPNGELLDTPEFSSLFTASKEWITEYINNKNYTITDCLSGRINGEKKTYYLLSKMNYN